MKETYCEICRKELYSNYSLRRHKARDNCRKPIKNHLLKFECNYNHCGFSYTTKTNLNCHISEKHLRARKLVCCLCSSTTTSKIADEISTIDRHIMAKHKTEAKTENGSFSCEKCLKVFTTIFLLQKHFDTHEKRFKCSKCEPLRWFKKKDQLREHTERDHENKGKFKCPVCKKEFMTKKYLKLHCAMQH